MRYLFICLLLLFSTYARPQNNYRDRFFEPGKVLLLYVVPSGLFDFHGGGIPIGAEYLFSKHHSVSLDVALPLLYSVYDKLDNVDCEHNSDLYTRLSYRFYIFPGRRHARQFYAGAQIFYRAQQYTLGRSSYEEPADYGDKIVTGFTKADVSKKMLGFNIMFGVPVKLGGHTYLDISTGLGIKRNDVTYSNVAVAYTQRYEDRSGMFGALGLDNDYNTKGVSGGLYVPFCLKLSYIPGRK